MRVKNILNENPMLSKSGQRKTKRLKFQMGVLALTATILGSFGLIAVASPVHISDKDAQPSVRVPPIFPANCKANIGKFAASVSVKFDVDKAGNVENIQVTKSDNPCFNQASINSTAKWKFAPVLHKGKPRKRKGVQAMIKYMLSDN